MDAQAALARVVKDGKWVLAKKPVSGDLIEVFISKSAYHENYQPLFPQVQQDHPVLHLWLKNDEDVSTDIEAWGVQKTVYMFKNLKDYYDCVDKKKKKDAKAGGKSDKSKGKKRAI